MAFKEKFKYFKKKNPEPNFNEVINPRKANSDFLSELTLNCEKHYTFEEDKYGLKHPSHWKVYELKTCPGFIFVVNPFTSAGQRFWITRSLADYTKKPSVTNLDKHDVFAKHLEGTTWWDIVSSNSELSYSMRKKLRWVTMGYHHNWDTKIYSESSKDPFPNDLNQLSKFIVKTIFNTDFHAEACIVNFYHMDSCLSGHTDCSEPNAKAPLISFSFGQTAVFLIGGTTLEENPHAIFLESGDIAIMMNESRLRYHGVPKIIHTSNEPWNMFQENTQSIYIPELTCKTYPISCKDFSDRKLWTPFGDYVRHSRININVRQVLLPNQSTLDGP